MYRFFLMISMLMVCGCQRPTVAAPGQADLGLGLMTQQPALRDGVCFGSDVTPAIIETVTDQVVVTPAEIAADGTVLAPATYSTETQQRIVQDRREVWFRTPCAAEMTVPFIATLQRALKARGLYLEPVTGEMNAGTAAAIRRYQEPLGLDSPQLALEAARGLGIIATDLELE